MDTISSVVLILLSMAGYSAGAVGKAGKFRELKPQILDLILVVIVWTGAIYSRIALDVNNWFLILIWVVISIIIGIMAVIPRKLSKEMSSKGKLQKATSENFLKRTWQRWKNFSKRMESFQSRVILSLFFFLFVSPFALAVKIFSDPLKIKPQGGKSYWQPRRELTPDLDHFRKQF